ncbi:diadenylate cyclase CdaA [bacterium]|nr:diadenylate cyclase CdaA [bacterium]
MDAIAAFLSISWPKLIEMLAVATLFYYLLLAARGTKGTVVIGFIITLGAVYFVCTQFQMITLKTILDQILFYGPLALLVILAPEIRKMLERAGKTYALLEWFMTREEAEEQSPILDILTKTAQELSEKRIGAIFVVERKEPVIEHLVPGTELQALPDKRFIQSLFEKHNPLHDGAVVIREDRIWSAGNFLPISESKFISDELGTRHRASVGLSERCDAVVVVVSEESGEISVAFNGRLARGLDEAQFIEQLKAVVEPNETFASIVPRPAFI